MSVRIQFKNALTEFNETLYLAILCYSFVDNNIIIIFIDTFKSSKIVKYILLQMIIIKQ